MVPETAFCHYVAFVCSVDVLCRLASNWKSPGTAEELHIMLTAAPSAPLKQLAEALPRFEAIATALGYILKFALLFDDQTHCDCADLDSVAVDKLNAAFPRMQYIFRGASLDSLALRRHVPSRVLSCIERYGLYQSRCEFAWTRDFTRVEPESWEAEGEPPVDTVESLQARFPSERTRHVALLGGSFSPITDAHLLVACNVLRALQRSEADEDSSCRIPACSATSRLGAIDEVWVVPCGARPDKPSLTVTPSERCIMSALACEDFFGGERRVKVMPLELREDAALPS